MHDVGRHGRHGRRGRARRERRPVRDPAGPPVAAPRARTIPVPRLSHRVCGPPYITGDPDLGPTVLPRTGHLGAILRGYVPLGELSPQHFLSRYWDYTTNNYRFPPDAGFGRSGDFPNG
ncbi:hypothetical protein ACFSTC_60115 [Nonomuraea ferruginea]